jgi:HEPN domain-containing protein
MKAEYYMSGKKITESAISLFTRANGDIKGIDGYIKEEDFDENNRAYGAYHAQQMAEKLLKGYLIYNHKEPEWGHNLIEYFDDVFKINKSFKDIENEILHLNIYNAGIKYDTEIEVDIKKFEAVLKDVKRIYNHPEIQKIYNEYVENNLCKKTKSEFFDKMIDKYNNIIKNYNNEKAS